MKRLQQHGFTLVELAIVLVIIGLIVSSVLVGQDLIKSAELRATTTQYNQFQAAVNTFIGKYNALPGDVSTNYGFFATADVAQYENDGVGDGDGLIEDNTVGASSTDGVIGDTSSGSNDTIDGEIALFWFHLSAPGRELIPGGYLGAGKYGVAPGSTTGDLVIGEDMPAMKFGGHGWSVFYASEVTARTATTALNKHYFLTGITASPSSTDVNISNDFVPVDAFNIDDKIDDGVPNAGAVQAVLGGAILDDDAQISATGSNTGDCANSGPTPDEYAFIQTTKNCALIFEMATF